MKLFNDTITNTPPQAPPVEAPVLSAEYQVAYVADKPTPVIWALPLSWKLSNLPKPEIKMHQGVKDWCSYSTAFSNWLFTCLTVFVCIATDEMVVPVPDQFITDLDVKELTLSRTYSKGGVQIITVYA